MGCMCCFLIIWYGYVSTKKEIKLSEDLARLREILDVVVIYDNFPSFLKFLE